MLESFNRTHLQLNEHIKNADAAEVSETAALLHKLLDEQLALDKQKDLRLRERTKKLDYFYKIHQAMLLGLSVDGLCQQIIGHLASAMQFPELIVPVIELDGKRFASEKYKENLALSLTVEIKVYGKSRGQLHLFYSEDNAFLLPEEQDFLNAIAHDLQLWLERKQAEDDLLASQKRVNLVEKALDSHSIVAITDGKGIITQVNDKFCAVSKYSRDELIGQDHRIINAGFHSREFIKNVWKTIMKGAVWKGEFKNRAKDGSYYWLDTTIVPFLDDAGKPQQFIAIRTEITERKKLEQQREERVKALARSNEELGQFVYVASHDLQEPLRAVTSCVQLLKRRYDGKLDAQADKFISHAIMGTERMLLLINGLLAYSRIERDQPVESVDCESLLAEVLDDLVTSIHESSAVVTHDPLPILQGTAFQLKQLFENLISNALKFSRANKQPKVHIAALLKEGEWLFSIADNGIGVEPQYFDRIFLVFQRLHTRLEYPGTGIGLAICKKVVECHGGRIWVESQLGKGAHFNFIIPVENHQNETKK